MRQSRAIALDCRLFIRHREMSAECVAVCSLRAHQGKCWTRTAFRFIAARHIIVSPAGDGFFGPTDEALAAAGQTRTVSFAVSSFVTLIEAVAQSELIAMAPERLARRYADRLDLFKAPLDVQGFGIAMVWHDRTKDHPAHRWLRDRLSAFCKVTPRGRR